MSNNHNILTVQEVRSLYHTSNPYYKCSYPDCGKEETKRNKFKQCSRCQAAKYCSKECQTKHWKAEHKLHCTDIKVVLFTVAVKMLVAPVSFHRVCSNLIALSASTTASVSRSSKNSMVVYFKCLHCMLS